MVKTTNSEKLRELCSLMANQGMNVYVHSGSMHRDDVEAVAVATLATGDPDSVTICRVNDKELAEKGLNDANALILDIGGGRFDHHFRDYPEKKKFYDEIMYWDDEKMCYNPVEMSAVAKLWDYCGPEVVYNTILLYLNKDPISSEICWETAKNIEGKWISKISDTDTRGQKASPNPAAAKITSRSAAGQLMGLDPNKVFLRLVQEAREDLVAMIICEYNSLVLAGSCRDLAEDVAQLGHPNWVNLTESWVGPYIPAADFRENGTLVRYTIIKSNRNEGEWNLQTADIKEAKLDGVETMPGFLKRPIPTLAIFDSSEAAEAAATTLSKDLNID